MLANLRRSEVNLSDAEAEGERLRAQINSAEETIDEIRKTPHQRLVEENESLCEQIRKLGAAPDRCSRRFALSSSRLGLLRQENEKLKRQFQELAAKNGQKNAGTQPMPKENSEPRGRVRFHRQPRA